MIKNKVELGSLAMDLKRVAIGFHGGSDAMAKRFLKEALKREKEIDRKLVKPYLRTILDQVKYIGHRKDKHATNKLGIAEDALMYSTLLQNACLR